MLTDVMMMVAPFFTGMLKRPSASVAVPRRLSFSRTVAPETGLPASSVTFPVIFLVCAAAGMAARHRSRTNSTGHRRTAGKRWLVCFGWFIPFLFGGV
jgi:hypothetical protein